VVTRRHRIAVFALQSDHHAGTNHEAGCAADIARVDGESCDADAHPRTGHSYALALELFAMRGCLKPTAATWLDHAGVSPKVASEIMGHKTPEYQPGAASITLRRYTHTLPGELERARDLLDHFLADREQQHAADQPG
jgi:hypothetical protein